jgi:hypothetical protein
MRLMLVRDRVQEGRRELEPSFPSGKLVTAKVHDFGRQVRCQLFTERHLRNSYALPSIQGESRPAGLVTVVTDF